MKKAFDANVSRSKPRMRLGATLSKDELPKRVSQAEVEGIAKQVAHEALQPIPAYEAPPPSPPEPGANLSDAIKVRANSRVYKSTAKETLQETPEIQHRSVRLREKTPPAHSEASSKPTQTHAASHAQDMESGERRERLKERLRVAREVPRAEPLPDTLSEAGVLAVERISTLQNELSNMRTLNLRLTQDCEVARRQAERASEEARVRMDEAKRLCTETEHRTALLNDLERELAALEEERNESLLALQETRQLLESATREQAALQERLQQKAQEINECLAEEERLASELKTAQENAAALKRTADILKDERDVLARQVTELQLEREELLAARQALEAVHRALNSTATR